MTFTTILALFGALVVLAITPGPGILVVVARTLSANLRHGCVTIAGVVLGDFVYISFVLLGLAALSNVMGTMFELINYLGAAYLVWLGASMLKSKTEKTPTEVAQTNSYIASFAAGLVITLGNPKVIFFYLSFLPAFLDLNALSIQDVVILLICVTLAVGGVMFGYAYTAHKARDTFRPSQQSVLVRYSAAALLIGCGIYIALR
jgi:threonine/homoserine/homoserine lactone efflux protein